MTDVWKWIISVAAGLVVLAAAYKTAVRPVIRAIRRMIGNVDRIGVVVLGNPNALDARGRPSPVPSLTDRLGTIDDAQAEIRKWQAEHQSWHAGAGRANGGVADVRTRQPGRH